MFLFLHPVAAPDENTQVLPETLTLRRKKETLFQRLSTEGAAGGV